MFRTRSLLILLSMSVFASSCGMPNSKKDEPVKPPKIWTVEANVPFSSYYDGICAKRDEFIVVRP